jgi:hypothetical protein
MIVIIIIITITIIMMILIDGGEEECIYDIDGEARRKMATRKTKTTVGGQYQNRS